MNLFPQNASEIGKNLSQNALKGNWDKVIKIYEENEELHTTKITSSGDTALHIAINDGKESVVEELVAIVYQTKGSLKAQNKLGNTPLHQAVYLGNARMCYCIASRDSRLMGIRNYDNETPFFLAVRHGRKDAFYSLHSICGADEGYKYCRGRQGETILHSAIYGGYFDLAFDIATHYDKLTNVVNEHGLSPLHILANSPSAFRSGSQLRCLDKLIYHCMSVDELQHKKMHKEDAKYPENYSTCLTIFNLLWNVLLGHGQEKHIRENIEDNVDGRQAYEKHPKGFVSKLMIVLCGSRTANAERRHYERDEGSRERNVQRHEFFPKNYTTLANFIRAVLAVILAGFCKSPKLCLPPMSRVTIIGFIVGLVLINK